MTKRVLGLAASASIYFAWAGVAHAATINVTDTQGGRIDNQRCNFQATDRSDESLAPARLAGGA